MQIAIGFLWALIGALSVSSMLWLYHKAKRGSYARMGAEIISQAKEEAAVFKKQFELSLRQSEIEQQRRLEEHVQQERRKLLREEERIKLKEDKLELRLNSADKKLSDLERREESLQFKQKQAEEQLQQLNLLRQQLVQELEHHAGLSAQEARELLLERLTNDVKTDAANMIRRSIKEAEEEGEDRARQIIVTAINRLAVATSSEATVRSVPLPNEEMKGRIIGREGRNIRAFERATGVNIIVDDTPGLAVLAGFDPFRLEVAKLAIIELIADGRIHPTRIDETVEKAQIDLMKKLRQCGEDAALRAGAMNLHPELIAVLGRLKLRHSFGQNVLEHSLEVSHIMGLMAAELGLNIRLAKRIGLLHDVGKALSHEVEGSHAIIGHDLALKYGESHDVATGIGCHHLEMPPSSLEGSLCIAADAISASRPGGRIEAVEEYIKRLKKLETLASGFDGVEKAYALQAGREIFVTVSPDRIDDTNVSLLALELSKKIENELSYPGKIKVVVIRETKAVAYAR